MSYQPPIVFIIGGPGSGKGTLCERIVKRYGFTHLSTGDLLRDEVASGSERGNRLNEIMKQGLLVPIDEMLAILRDAIQQRINSSNGFLIDGYPREVEQAIRFETEVGACSLVSYLDCQVDVMMDRLIGRGKTSGRVDDNIDTIRVRVETFQKHTMPLLDHYADRVVKFDAHRTPDEIFEEASVHLDKLVDNAKSSSAA